MNTQIMDAPAALGFVISQRSHIEAEVMRKPYPTILYPRLMQVDTSANQFAASVTFFTRIRSGAQSSSTAKATTSRALM